MMHALALIWVAVILAVMPVQAIWTRYKVQTVRPTRMRAYASTISGLTVMGAITVAIDWFSGRVGTQAVQRVLPVGTLSAWTVVTLLACAAVWFSGMLQRRLWHHRADEVVTLLFPRTTHERWMFAVVAVVAGIVEEYVMRGFCLLTLSQATGSILLSVVLVTIGFAVGHGYQGAWATVRTGLLGAILSIPVVMTGTLLASMVAHAGTDLLSGAFGYGLLRRWDLLHEESSSC